MQVLLAQPVAPSAPGTHVPLRKRSKQLKGELGGLGRAGGRAGGARSASLQGQDLPVCRADTWRGPDTI